MNRPLCLIETVQRLLERTYDMPTGLIDPSRFVIGDRGYRRFFGREVQHRRVGSPHGDARILLRETSAGPRVSLYLPDSLIEQLERHPPQLGLGDDNVDAFATLVEEVDHLLLIAERCRVDRTLTMFELELHANVSKHLVLARFLAGGAPRLSERRRAWLRHHLFDKIEYCEDDPEIGRRYREAARWAIRLLEALASRRAATARIALLRRFHDADSTGKLELIRRAAA